MLEADNTSMQQPVIYISACLRAGHANRGGIQRLYTGIRCAHHSSCCCMGIVLASQHMAAVVADQDRICHRVSIALCSHCQLAHMHATMSHIRMLLHSLLRCRYGLYNTIDQVRMIQELVRSSACPVQISACTV